MLKNEKNIISKSSSALLPTPYGAFRVVIYKSNIDKSEHTLLSIGDTKKQPLLVRVHSQCLTGDTFFSYKCDCGGQLRQSMRIIGKKGKGIIIYLSQEGRGIGLYHKINAYALQEKGLDTVEANQALGFPDDKRDYLIASEILHSLNISKIILLTNNPDKIKQLDKNGIKVIKRVALETKPQKHNKKYLITKKQKMRHQLSKV